MPELSIAIPNLDAAYMPDLSSLIPSLSAAAMLWHLYSYSQFGLVHSYSQFDATCMPDFSILILILGATVMTGLYIPIPILGVP